MPEEKGFVIKDTGEGPKKTESSKGAAAILPGVNFSTFVLSLNASALMHLGIIEDPTTGSRSKHMPMAKQAIDTLAMLQEKTAGNLTSDETNMLRNLLADLRIMYVREKD
ncbi:MAG: DUF1844 domain-containing protein [Pseudomonadota bacterium]